MQILPGTGIAVLQEIISHLHDNEEAVDIPEASLLTPLLVCVVVLGTFRASSNTIPLMAGGCGARSQQRWIQSCWCKYYSDFCLTHS